VAVCRFESAGSGALGRQVADALVMKLRRYDEDFVLVEPMDLEDVLAAKGLAVQFGTKPDTLAAFAREALEAQVFVWGKVEVQRESSYTIRVRALDLRQQPGALYVDQAFPAEGLREVPFAVQRIVNALRRDDAAPDPGLDLREPGPTKPDPKVLARPNLLVNGDFEQGDKNPVGWEPVDGLSSFWVSAPDRDGKCIKFDTDVNWEQWKAWRKKFTLGTDEAPPAPIRGTGPKYDTVGAFHGAALYTADFIPVKKGQTYRISYDFRGRMAGDLFFAKVFVKGYAQYPDERREVYRAYKSCRVKADGREWEHFTRAFNPTAAAPDVQWIKVELYCYWPPGVYYFDNVHLCEEP
jgi:hypothetical protein